MGRRWRGGFRAKMSDSLCQLQSFTTVVEFDRECLSRAVNRQLACGQGSGKADINVSGGGLHVVARLSHLLSTKGRVVFDLAYWIATPKSQSHEIFWRPARIAQIGIILEPKATIIVGISEEYAPCGTFCAQFVETSPDQGASNATALQVGPDRYRPQPEPFVIFAVKCDWRKGDVTDDLISIRGNQRNR